MVERHGPLTWAQQEWFADLGVDEESPWAFQANFCTELPGHRLPLGPAATALRDVLARHEGLRTRLRSDVDGHRDQAVDPVDDLADVLRIVPEGSAADAAMAEACRTSFRLRTQWPVLFVLAVRQGAVTRIGVVVDHWAVDGWGMRVLCSDLSRALRARGRGLDPSDGRAPVEQPLDTAAWESGPDGERYAERAERYWRRQLESLRADLGTWSPKAGPDPAEPILHSHWIASGRAAAAAETIATATGIPASAAYLLAFGSTICEVEGTAAAGIHALTANRLSAATQQSVRKAVMPAPVVVRAGRTATYARHLADCATQQLHGHRFANMAPGRADTVIAESLGDLRGSGATAARFNYIDNSIVGSAANSRSLGVESIPFTDPSIQGRITADPPRPGGSRYILSVQHRPTGALMTLACHEDTAWSPAAEDMIWHIEDLLVWAAAGYPGAAPAFGRTR